MAATGRVDALAVLGDGGQRPPLAGAEPGPDRPQLVLDLDHRAVRGREPLLVAGAGAGRRSAPRAGGRAASSAGGGRGRVEQRLERLADLAVGGPEAADRGIRRRPRGRGGRGRAPAPARRERAACRRTGSASSRAASRRRRSWRVAVVLDLAADHGVGPVGGREDVLELVEDDQRPGPGPLEHPLRDREPLEQRRLGCRVEGELDVGADACRRLRSFRLGRSRRRKPANQAATEPWSWVA